MSQYKKELLAEHKTFRNQLLWSTLIALIVCIWVPELLGHTIVLGLVALFNVFSYRRNLKDYNTLNNLKSKK